MAPVRLRTLICVGLLFISQISLFNPLLAQESVAPVTGWLATVDEASQQIVLSWNPSADSQAIGYHICTGNPCLNYDSVFGRFDTSFVCIDHSVTDSHVYRLHVFDTAYHVSPLTPYFGNVVLSAEVPRCSTTVTASWTPYRGMPGGVRNYKLLARLEPFDESFSQLLVTDSAGPFSYSFDIAESTTRVWLKVQAIGFGDSHGNNALVSQSNLVSVERLTVDTAAFLAITDLCFDSIHLSNQLTFDIDTAYRVDHYTLFRSVDDAPWDSIAALSFRQFPFTYIDTHINPYDSLFCYRLSVLDACGLNPRYSDTLCIVVPTPPEPAVAIPTVVLVGDPANGTFLPRLRGLKGDLYELSVYNRQGLLVFDSKDSTRGWTPSANIPQGAYTYALRCRFNNNRVKVYTGTVIVIK